MFHLEKTRFKRNTIAVVKYLNGNHMEERLGLFNQVSGDDKGEGGRSGHDKWENSLRVALKHPGLPRSVVSSQHWKGQLSRIKLS